MAAGDLPSQEELEKKLELLEKIRDVQGELSAKQEQQLVILHSTLENVDNIAKANDKRMQQLERQLEAEEARDTTNDAKIAAIEARIKKEKELADFVDENQGRIDKALEDTSKKAADARKELIKAHGERDKLAEKSIRGSEKDLEGLAEHGKAYAAGILEATEQMGAGIVSMFKSPEMLMMALFPGVGSSLSDINQKVAEMPAALDENIRAMTKNTGLAADTLGKTMVNALDPLYAKRTGVEIGKLGEPMHSIGLDAKNMGDSMKDLLANVRIFRPSFQENNEAASLFMANLVGGLAKVGVSTESSTKLLDKFTKAHKMTPKEATKSLKQVTNIADSLGLSMGKVTADFENMTPNLAEYGDRMVEVFGELQAQAQATGVEVGTLMGYAQKLDTFSGAAQHVQQLNSVLGGTYLSVTDLVHADPAEKIAMMQDALGQAGIDFESADRRMQQVIATAAGFENVEEARRVFLNQEEAEEAGEALDVTAMSQEELKAKIEDSMTTAETMQKGLSNLTGGMNDFLKTVRPGSVQFANMVNNAFGEIVSKTENSQAAMHSFTGMLATAAGTIGAIGDNISDKIDKFVETGPTGKVGKALALLFGIGAVGAMTKGAIEEISGEELFGEKTGAARAQPQRGQSPVATTGAGDLTNLMNSNTIAVNELVKALQEAKVPVQVSVDVDLDGEKVGEGVAATTLDILGSKVLPAQ